MDKRFEDFFKDCKTVADEIVKLVKAEEFIPIFAHSDADGVAAGSIIGKAIHRLGGKFLLRIIDRIDEDVLREIKEIASNIYLFAEIGSGYLDILQKYIPENLKIIVLDHHKPLNFNPKNILHLNPMFYGIDGASEVSGSSVCYFIAKGMSEDNVDLSCLAIVGALGDLQDKGRNRCLQSLNKLVVEDAEKAGLVNVETDLLFYGRETRPIHKAIATTMNPFIPGLSGEEDRCLSFLTSLGVPVKVDDRWRSLVDLSKEEKEKIFSQLTVYLASKGFTGDSIFQLIGCVYSFTLEDKWTSLRDAREYAALLNACVKMGKPGLAVSLCLGCRGGFLEEAQNLLNEYRKTIGGYINVLIEKKDKLIIEDKNVYAVKCHNIVDEKMLSPITSILSSSFNFKPDKPIIALTKTRNGKVKISARASQILVDKGLNLGLIMQEVSEKVGGKGGGHNIAAGATIPEKSEEEFIKYVNRAVGKELEKTKS
ncbi:MAG: DHH family phosphoesterase [Candidatus Bathyarchaeota archaeon]|nr:DHH family phosphoesterase [Candidatus Bathyarchaeota archaeon]